MKLFFFFLSRKCLRLTSLNIYFLSLCLFQSGCSVTIGPEYIVPVTAQREPIFRLGDITEAVTGSWAQTPAGTTKSFSAFRSALSDELRKKEYASRFSASALNLNVNIDLISDHEDDGPRLGNLGGLSIITFGIVPLNYFSEWTTDCKITVTTPDGQPAADYTFQERGTYKIWAYPLTMFSLLGAAIRGDGDWREVQKRVANNLAVKIIDALDKDYDMLAQKIKKPGQAQAKSNPDSAPKPLII